MLTIVRFLIAAATIVAVAEISNRYPRAGALLLSLPIVSILALTFSWVQHHDLNALSKLARETIVFVVLGLPLFVPLAFAHRLHIGFWVALIVGIALAVMSVGLWFYILHKWHI